MSLTEGENRLLVRWLWIKGKRKKEITFSRFSFPSFLIRLHRFSNLLAGEKANQSDQKSRFTTYISFNRDATISEHENSQTVTPIIK